MRVGGEEDCTTSTVAASDAKKTSSLVRRTFKITSSLLVGLHYENLIHSYTRPFDTLNSAYLLVVLPFYQGAAFERGGGQYVCMYVLCPAEAGGVEC